MASKHKNSLIKLYSFILAISLVMFDMAFNHLKAASIPVSIEMAWIPAMPFDEVGKELARDALVEKALSEAAVYVESEEVLDTNDHDGELREFITTLGGGFVTIRDIEVVDQRWNSITVAAVADIDQEPLMAQIASIRRNRSLEEQNRILSAKLEALQNQLDMQDAELMEEGAQAARMDLAETRFAVAESKGLRSNIAQHYEVSEEVMERLLFSNDILNSTTPADVRAELIRYEVWHWVRKNAAVTPPIISFEGDIYLDYSVDSAPIVGLLQEWFAFEHEGVCLNAKVRGDLDRHEQQVADRLKRSGPPLMPFLSVEQGPYVVRQRIINYTENGFYFCFKPSPQLSNYNDRFNPSVVVEYQGKPMLHYKTDLSERERRRSRNIEVRWEGFPWYSSVVLN